MARAALHKIGDIRQKTSDELAALLLELRKEQFNIRFQRATGQTEGIGRIREARREIARIKTIQGQRESDAVKTASGQPKGDAATAGPGQPKGGPASAGPGQPKGDPASAGAQA
jgi:large subunit ribosomal protein L29